MTEIPLPEVSRQLSHEGDPSGPRGSAAAAEADANTSMPTEMLRHLGEGHTDGSPPMKALRSVAASNEWDTDAVSWEALRQQIRSQVQKRLDTYSQSESALFDTSLTPPYPLTLEQVSALQTSLFSSLDAFTAPPFTIQRLSELTLTPSTYVTLPKYIRALQRCLGVSSAQKDFPPEESLVTLPSSTLHPSITHPLGGDTTIALRSRSSSLSSSASASSSEHSTPLLSPIPWLNRELTPEPQINGAANTSSDSAQLLSPPAGPTQTHPGASPTGGRIDELDPGQEARDAGTADSDPASLSERPQALSGLGLALHGNGGTSSSTSGHALQERFTQGSEEPKEESTPAAGVPEDVHGAVGDKEDQQQEDTEMKA